MRTLTVEYGIYITPQWARWVTLLEGTAVSLAMRVKTVNTQPGGKTVGAQQHRYRLRWIPGIGALSAQPNRSRGRRDPRDQLWHAWVQWRSGNFMWLRI